MPPDIPSGTDWREKYYSTLETLETTQKEFQEAVSMLRRDISKVSFAGNGYDPKLDEYLRLLRRDISNGSALQQVHNRVGEVSNVLKEMEENAKKSDTGLFNTIGQLIVPLESVKFSRKIKKQLTSFTKKSKNCEDQKAALLLLREFIQLLKLVIDEYNKQVDSYEQQSQTVWERLSALFKKKEKPSTTTTEQPHAREDSIQSPPLMEMKYTTEAQIESEQTVQDKPTDIAEQLPGVKGKRQLPKEPDLPEIPFRREIQLIPYDVNHALIRLIDAIEFPGNLEEQAEEIRHLLGNHLVIHDLLSVIERLISLLLGTVSSEKHRFEEFLEKVNGRLEEVHQFLDRAKTNEHDKKDSTEQIDKTVREQVEDIRVSFQKAEKIEDLQALVESNLNIILSKMDEYRALEAKRMSDTMDTLAMMNERLVETESDANKLRQALLQQKDSASKDALTKLRNRSAYDNEVMKAQVRFEANNEEISVILADIDHFKSINDNYGHAAGDAVLRIIGKLLDKNIAKKDFVARYGGEEFVMIIYDEPLEQAVAIAEKLRQVIASWKFTYDKEPVTVTMSFGVALFQKTDDVKSVFQRADSLLYKAKGQGRNCVASDSRTNKEGE